MELGFEAGQSDPEILPTALHCLLPAEHLIMAPLLVPSTPSLSSQCRVEEISSGLLK